MMDAQPRADAQDRVSPLAPTSHYLELIHPDHDPDMFPPYPGGHFLHMLAAGPKHASDVAHHLCIGPAAAQEMLDEHVSRGLVLHESGLYSLSIHGVLDALTTVWPKRRWQHERHEAGDFDCTTCLVSGDK
ncbi:hypothetical protein [Pseudoclavibacter helvolus]|uniref:hypothetical protein n=1 Tax=Pseudoclavibacter helvolus TaxID=255205 RepID=UPI003C775D78